MKLKLLTSFLLTVILSLALVSAADLISITKGPALSDSNSQTYFDIRANTNVLMTMSNPVLQISDGKNHYLTVSLSPSSVVNEALSSGATKRITAVVIVDSGFASEVKTYTFPDITINTTDAVNSSSIETEKVSLTFLKSFCKFGENGTDLVISKVDIRNKDGDDLEWSPLDEIEIEVEVSNEGTERIKEVTVELGLFDSDGKNIVRDLNDLSNKQVDLGSIQDGKDDTATFTFKVPTDFKDESYKIVLKAYSDDKGEKNICTSQSSDLDNNYYQIIDGQRETDEENHVIVDNIKISPSPAACSDRVQVSADVVNIGDEDYQDQVKVTLYNRELEIDLEQIIREDFDQGDSSIVDFEFDVPENAAEKTYTLEFKTYYDYDTGDDEYNLESEKAFISVFSVKGNCQEILDKEGANARITAELDPETPEAIAGKQLTVQANIQNTGAVLTSYSISVIGNSAWSSLVSIEPQQVTLDEGDSEDITLVFNIDAEAEGSKEFTIKATYGGKITEQKVALTINKPAVSGGALIEHIKNNWFIYLIVIVNIILIIAIISVIRRMLSPRRDEEYH